MQSSYTVPDLNGIAILQNSGLDIFTEMVYPPQGWNVCTKIKGHNPCTVTSEIMYNIKNIDPT